MKHYFLGAAANYSRKQRLLHTFTIGRKKDCSALKDFLLKKYSGNEVFLTKNGRSALALALKANFDKGDGIIVNGFTCYAVYEAIRAAGMVPIFTDIDKSSLNFNNETLSMILATACPSDNSPQATQVKSLNSVECFTAKAIPKGIIIQNSFGNAVDIEAIERLTKKYGLTIIEDLAHSAGVKYADGREVGTVGAATMLSFGKDKAIDTISGGAVIFRHPCKNKVEAPSKIPKLSDHLRARFYPLFGAISRGLSYVYLGGVWMRMLIKIRWVEKSADNKLDLERKISKFEAKLALKQLKNLKKAGEGKIREFYLVNNREELLAKLKKAGYYFDGFWYEKPVSPERYYKRVHFPEEACPTAVEISKKIINFPTYYKKQDLKKAYEILKDYEESFK